MNNQTEKRPKVFQRKENRNGEFLKIKGSLDFH